MEITPQLKDKVLNFLCEADFEKNIYANLRDTLNELEISFEEFNAILTQFQRLNFISNLNLRKNVTTFFLIVHLEANDFKLRGGFFAHEVTFKLTLEKLSMEIDNLEKGNKLSVSKIAEMSANIATCLSLIKF